MKPLCPRGPFLSRANTAHFPSLLLRIYHFSTVSSTASYPNFPRCQEENSRNIRVSVWWDFENCHIPNGVNKFRVTQTITAAIRANGIKGPIQITAFGDVTQLSAAGQEALTSTGVLINHVPRGGKNSADRSLLVDLMCWTSQNPPPAHLFLISGDSDFAGVLHRLRMVNYNILLAGPENSNAVLCSAASIMWYWFPLIRGEDVNGKLYNQPPDGSYASWYGHYKRPLEDPFAIEAHSDAKDETCLKSKSSPTPRQIQSILRSHPNGMSIADLSKKLHIPKGYGDRKLGLLITAMPNIGKVRVQGDGKYFVMPVRAIRPSKDNVGQVDAEQMEDGSFKVEIAENSESDAEQMEDGSFKVEIAENSESDAENEKKTVLESLQEPISSEKPEHESDKRMSGEKIWKSNHPNADAASSESLADESTSKEQTSLFQRVVKSLTFWRTSDEPKLSSDQSNETINEQISHSSPVNEIFSQNTFWSDMKYFLDSSRGSTVSLSTTRECIAQKLKTEGPAALKTLDQNDLLHLVDLLIDEKKLVLENPSDVPKVSTPPPEPEGGSSRSKRRQILKACKEFVNDILRQHPDGYNLGKFKLDFEDKYGYTVNHKFLGHKNLSSFVKTLPGVVVVKDSLFPSRSVTQVSSNSDSEWNELGLMEACKEFVKDILRQHPDGYNLSKFKQDFENKYGYTMNLKILGHKKVSSFVKTLPGVVVVNESLFPSRSVTQVSSNSDSEWNELGPVSSSNPKNGGDTYVSSSDSEDEFFEAKQSEVSNKEDTALLQILDSCYDHKDESIRSFKAKKGDKVMMMQEESTDKLIQDLFDCMKKTGNGKMQ